MASILVLHGPNLNLLGRREPDQYGAATLAEIDQALMDPPAEGIDFILFNPAAFTHTSVALRDALLAVRIPFIEVHLSNVHRRETFRHHSYFSDIAEGVICGLGATGYRLALAAALEQLDQAQE